MTRTHIILIIGIALALVALAMFLKAPKYQYSGSNYYGGGNVEEQLAFIGGYKTSMQNPYS